MSFAGAWHVMHCALDRRRRHIGALAGVIQRSTHAAGSFPARRFKGGGKPWTAEEGRTNLEFLDDKSQVEAAMANDRHVMAGGQAERRRRSWPAAIGCSGTVNLFGHDAKGDGVAAHIDGHCDTATPVTSAQTAKAWVWRLDTGPLEFGAAEQEQEKVVDPVVGGEEALCLEGDLNRFINRCRVGWPLAGRRRESQACCLPRVVARHPMTRGVWNIPIPEAGKPVEPDILLVPVVGFDTQGYRLGYGGGYYDRTLAALPTRPRAIGVGFELSQIATIHPQPVTSRWT